MVQSLYEVGKTFEKEFILESRGCGWVISSSTDKHFILLRNNILNENFNVHQYDEFSDIDIAKFNKLDGQFKNNIYKWNF